MAILALTRKGKWYRWYSVRNFLDYGHVIGYRKLETPVSLGESSTLVDLEVHSIILRHLLHGR